MVKTLIKKENNKTIYYNIKKIELIRYDDLIVLDFRIDDQNESYDRCFVFSDYIGYSKDLIYKTMESYILDRYCIYINDIKKDFRDYLEVENPF